MNSRKKPQRLLMLLGLLAVVLLSVLYVNRPVPDDTVRVMSLGGRYNQINRHVIGTQGTDDGISLKWSQLPRSVSFQSNGPLIRVYLLDMSSIDSSIDKVTTYLNASDEISKGREPSTETVVQRAIGVDHGIFHFPAWPWALRADYMLIVCADEEAQVIVRISYGK